MWLKPRAGLTGPRQAQRAERARRPPEREDLPPWQGDGPQGDSQVREQQRQLLPVGEVPLPQPPHTANAASKGMEAYQFKCAYSFISLYSCISHNMKVEKKKKKTNHIQWADRDANPVCLWSQRRGLCCGPARATLPLPMPQLQCSAFPGQKGLILAGSFLPHLLCYQVETSPSLCYQPGFMVSRCVPDLMGVVLRPLPKRQCLASFLWSFSDRPTIFTLSNQAG